MISEYRRHEDTLKPTEEGTRRTDYCARGGLWPMMRPGARGRSPDLHTSLLSHETVGWCHPFFRVIVGATASGSRLQ
eukprot:4283224-Prymnesium_polylepis.1